MRGIRTLVFGSDVGFSEGRPFSFGRTVFVGVVAGLLCLIVCQCETEPAHAQAAPAGCLYHEGNVTGFACTASTCLLCQGGECLRIDPGSCRRAQ